MSEVQSILHLLTGAVVCGCDSGGGGVHVVTVTHPNGKVTTVKLGCDFVPDQTSFDKWRSYYEFKSNLVVLDFNGLRKEATRVLKHFVGDPIPFVLASHSMCPIVPDFWRLPISVADLSLSKDAIYKVHGVVILIRLQDVIPWQYVAPFKDSPVGDIKLAAKSKFKALLILIIEAAAAVSRQFKVRLSCNTLVNNSAIFSASAWCRTVS